MTQWGLDTLFNPAKRHMDEEKRRLQSTRQQIGDNSGGKRIDLESGRVTISKNEDDDDAGSTAVVESDAPRASKESRKKRGAGAGAKDGEPSAAAKRAAARRGRTLD